MESTVDSRLIKKDKQKYVYFFGEKGKELSDLLGGKGANLSEMVKLGMPVPPGFTITTEAYKEYSEKNGLTGEIQEQIKEAVLELEKRTGKTFGGEDPLIVSVRSGAKLSMPGMLETILNLGLNDSTVKHLAEKTHNQGFAYDCYKRLIKTFSNAAFGISQGSISEHFGKIKDILTINQDTFITRILEDKETAARLKKCVSKETFEKVLKHYEKKSKNIHLEEKIQYSYLLEEFLCNYISTEIFKKKNHELEIGIIKNYIKKMSRKEFPQDVHKQLRQAIISVFDSWNSKKASEYRKINKIPDNLGTAVNVQMMVFGNRSKDSATGVVFTRNPATGKASIYGEYLPEAQGEDIVSGRRIPKKLYEMKQNYPEAYKQLASAAKKLEKHYKEAQDLEFTIEQGKLWILQTRKFKTSALASLQMVTDMVKEGLISKEEAVTRVSLSSIASISQEFIDPSKKYKVIAKGTGASLGIVSGHIALTSEKAEEYAKQGKNSILVKNNTSTEDLAGIAASIGILTKTGGSTSHAALITRAMNKCCITGCRDLKIKSEGIVLDYEEYYEGDMISLNGYTGEVIIGEVKTVKKEKNENLERIVKWSEKLINKKLETNADTPEEINDSLKEGLKVGLCRTEHLFFTGDNLNLIREYMTKNHEKRKNILKNLKMKQKGYYKKILNSAHNESIRIMLMNCSLDKFLPIERSLEENPHIKNWNHYKKEIEDLYVTQVKALSEAYAETRHKQKVEILIPSFVPENKRKSLKETLDKAIPKSSGITINPDPGTVYFIEDITKISNKKIQNADTVVTRPYNMATVKIALAQYSVQGKAEKYEH